MPVYNCRGAAGLPKGAGGVYVSSLRIACGRSLQGSREEHACGVAAARCIQVAWVLLP